MKSSLMVLIGDPIKQYSCIKFLKLWFFFCEIMKVPKIIIIVYSPEDPWNVRCSSVSWKLRFSRTITHFFGVSGIYDILVEKLERLIIDSNKITLRLLICLLSSRCLNKAIKFFMNHDWGAQKGIIRTSCCQSEYTYIGPWIHT